MAKEKIDVEKLESINVGVVGHIDHGKTTLLEKLTGKWTDIHSDELKRGITVKLGYADCVIREKGGEYSLDEGKPIRYVSFVDAPGHEMLMATMLSGAAMVDAAILVVSANEGIMPQTREHLMALQAKGVKNMIIVQNKIDLVGKEDAKKSYDKIQEFVEGTIAENSPVIPCSALQEINIDKILEEIVKIKVPEKDLDSDPVFVVARSFDINRPGSKISNLKGGVLGGSLKKGKIKEGDEIEIKPGMVIKKENQVYYETVKTKILSIYKGQNKVKEAIPGGSLALETSLDPILTKTDSLSGCVAGISGKIPEIQDKIKVKFDLLEEIFGLKGHEKVEDVKVSEPLLLSVNTSITVGMVKRIKGNVAELHLRIPVVPFEGESVGIARNIDGHWRLIGLGEIK